MIEISQKSIELSCAQRDLAEFHLKQFLTRKEIGFWQVPGRQTLWQSSQKLATELSGRYDSFVVIGTGGSSLGVRVLAEVFRKGQFYFIDNVDVQEYEHLVGSLKNLSRTLFIFISKSGGTIETLCALEFLHQDLQSRGLNLPKQSVVITELRSNPLFDWAQAHQIPTLEVPLDVGGRFSVLTPVGMFPAALMGLDLEAFRQGSEAALKNPHLALELMGQAKESFDREKWISLLWPYSSSMGAFGGWWQQLWAESLAKKVNRQGGAAPRVSSPMVAIGAVDQHSILQQVMEGAQDKYVLFMRIESCESANNKLRESQFAVTKILQGRGMGELLKAEALATQEALNKQGIETLTLTTKVLNEASLGHLFMTWMLTIGGLGEWLNINAFDQPGVELGKIITKEKLQGS